MTDATTTAGDRRRVLITGAGGRIGRALAERLRDRYALRLHYRTLPVPAEAGETDRVAADITRFDQVAPIMAEIDTVYHLAGDPRVPASWESVYANNIQGTYNVLEAARLAGVRRVVFASTNHVMGMYDIKRDWPVNNRMPQRPDSYYGVSKAFGEDLGRFYYDQWGLEFIALRIGWVTRDDKPAPEPGYSRAMWLSDRDCAHAFERATEAAVPYGVFYAISANPDAPWDLTDAKLQLGYRPQDSWRDQFPDDPWAFDVPPPAR